MDIRTVEAGDKVIVLGRVYEVLRNTDGLVDVMNIRGRKVYHLVQNVNNRALVCLIEGVRVYDAVSVEMA